MKRHFEVGQLYWTTEPGLGVSFDFDCDAVHPWQGAVVKIIGESIWLRNIDAPDPDSDPNGLFTAIVSRGNLYDRREDMPPCENQTCDVPS